MVHLKYNSLEFVKTFSASAADIKQFAKLDFPFEPSAIGKCGQN